MLSKQSNVELFEEFSSDVDIEDDVGSEMSKQDTLNKQLGFSSPY